MADSHRLEDDATLYVLGRLDAAERREFEANLAQSADLRELVRELEEGALALAMTSPRREPPRELWNRIESELESEANAEAVAGRTFSDWRRNGWAAAAACMVGWILYAVWVHSGRSVDPSPLRLASEPPTEVANKGEGHHADAGHTRRDGSADRDAALRVLQARLQDIAALRWQLGELTNQVNQLAQMLVHQQLLLSEPMRLKFFQLGPSSMDANGQPLELPVSTNIQRALFLAVARELGWSPLAASAGDGPDSQGTSPNPSGVDFVDLRQGTNQVANRVSTQNSIPADLAETSAAQSLASAFTNGVPGFVSGTNAVMAFDPASIPAGSSLAFVTAMPGGLQAALGTATLGSNPLVVTIPLGGNTSGGGNITVFAVFPGGSSNVLGHFPPQLPPP